MNNRYWKEGCPAIMNDGRPITNYDRIKRLDQYIKSINEIDSAHEYKYFLQKNSDKIINNERLAIEKLTICTNNVNC